MFHLMTHAFFKALLFMAAGSIIGAMAGVQSLDRMSGFKKALPFTYVAFIVGGLALSGVPPFSGFLSKDEILAFELSRGGWHIILGVVGYLGAFLTAIYTFRMIFRAFWGEPCEEARELEGGHLHHAEVHRNPADGEEEDTDVGFPGPEHVIAERSMPMKVAMGTLAVLATVAGFLQIPDVSHAVESFLEPTFADSRLAATVHPSDALTWLGLLAGGLIGIGGIFVAYVVWIKQPGTSARLIERFRPLHTFLSRTWYFNELIDAVFVRPAAAFGRFAQGSFERVFVDGTLVGGTSSVVRAGSAAVRALQTGFLRYYAALLLLGLAVTALYFLIQAS
jgi:NADH-quinone oxidoreductase subunit L